MPCQPRRGHLLSGTSIAKRSDNEQQLYALYALKLVCDLTLSIPAAYAGIIGLIALFIGMPFSSKLLKSSRRLKVRRKSVSTNSTPLENSASFVQPEG